jgi:hypothetical protein
MWNFDAENCTTEAGDLTGELKPKSQNLVKTETYLLIFTPYFELNVQAVPERIPSAAHGFVAVKKLKSLNT